MRRLLIAALFAFSLANLVRAALALQLLALADVPAAEPPAYVLVISVVWAAVFGACAIAFARSRAWAARVTIAVIVLYQANLWLNHAVFARSPEAEARAGFAALLSVASIVMVAGAAMFVQRKQ